jgi:branched-chain amino acid transport system permease protein
VLVFYFFSQVTGLSGFGGVNSVDLPGIVGSPESDPLPRYFVTLVVAVLIFLGLSALSRTAFGLGLQGVRDEPARMRALGFDVTLHRTIAFGIAAFVAGVAGVLSVFYNGRITPGSINLAQTIDVLIVAVIGGLYRLEGAWVGALTYALIDNYSREWVPEVGNVLGPARFNTLIGVLFLIIVLASPGGIIGISERVGSKLRRPRPHGNATPAPEPAID